ncbi:MAG: response regulator transcription factor [Elusimicrobia bacterium]|nr:response regulator transcription factor [Elusimicrobiota bacterium]
MKKKILIVDDEESIRELLKDTLEKEGYSIIEAKDSEEALRKAKSVLPDLVVLDLGIPTIGGLEVCRILRKAEETKNIPIIILTVRSREVDKVIGLEMGADDYITKPFNQRELLARVKAVLRRITYREGDKKIIKAGDILVDIESHVVKVKDRSIELRPKEFDLLCILLNRRGAVLSRDYLCESVLGYEYFGSTRAIDAHIKNLRRALGRIGDNIKTIRGLGYKFEIEE